MPFENQAAQLLERQKRYLRERGEHGLAARRSDLERLAAAIDDREASLLEALQEDLGKSKIEGYTTEVGFVQRDIRYALSHLRRWMKPRRIAIPPLLRPARAWTQPEPLGVALIIGPWNYPFQLLFSPLVGALAAGNAVCLKPSERAPATAEAVRLLCANAFAEDQLAVVSGGAETSAALASSPFDFIFFTGSGSVGRKVAAAAAENLVPTALELGGKSPCVVCADADLRLAARRIMWGKYLNAGQTCVAPDYVAVDQSVETPLLEELKWAAREFVPERDFTQTVPPDYSRIVNRHHFERLEDLLNAARVYDGGERDIGSLRFAPTILTDVDRDHPIMQEEIFGPLLPVIPFENFHRLLDRMRRLPSPLAAYIFSRDTACLGAFEHSMRAGSICANDTISQIMPAALPFGGVGASGYGRYRGKAAFDCFSNAKAVMRRGRWIDLPFRYPPYKASLTMIKTAYRRFF